jgi:hypothetical protein
MKYYVYAYLDSKMEENISFDDIVFTHRPVYIGKGKNNRMLDHFKDRKRFKTYFYNKLNKMILEENTPMVIKLKEFDNEQDAIKMEVDLIRFLGKKKNGGLLYNITDGGDGVSGYVYTDEQKEERRIISIKINSKQYFPDTRGENHPMFGKKHKQSSIEKMIEKRMGIKQSDEWIEKRTSKLRGIPLSQEHRDKLAEANRGKIVSEETRQKQSIAKIGKDPHNKGKIKDIILQIDSNGFIVKEWNNLNELVDYGFQKSNVINVCTGKRKSHGGFIWRYKSDFI